MNKLAQGQSPQFTEQQFDQFKKGLKNLKTPKTLQNVNDFDNITVQKLPVGGYYVREDRISPHKFYIVGRVLATGSSDHDMLRVPFEWSLRGIRELNKDIKNPEVFENVEEFVLNYAKQTAGAALPILISHKLGNLFDGNIDRSTAESRLEKSPSFPVFLCVTATNLHYNHFKLLIKNQQAEKTQEFEYQYDASKDGFTLSNNTDSTVFKSAQDLLRYHLLEEKNLLKKPT